jgi:hypothetical protein
MNVCKLEGNIIRFRCSGYPACKTYKKFIMREETELLKAQPVRGHEADRNRPEIFEKGS